jgi:hypothetical protein
MSKKKEPKEVIVGILVKGHTCPVHGPQIDDVRIVNEAEVAYSAPGADEAIRNSKSWGWSRSYDANWERTFGGGSGEVN